MKGILITIILLVFALTFTACATGDNPAARTAAASPATSPAENAEQAIIKMEQDWAATIVKGDLVTFTDHITADDYTFIDPMGVMTTKPQVIELFKSGGYKVQSIELDNLKVKVFGDAAIATYGQSEKSQYQGKDNSGHYIYTDVWLKRNGSWQVVRTQATKSEAPKK